MKSFLSTLLLFVLLTSCAQSFSLKEINCIISHLKSNSVVQDFSQADAIKNWDDLQNNLEKVSSNTLQKKNEGIGRKEIFRRAALSEDIEEQEMTTLSTQIFGQGRLHKVRPTAESNTLQTEDDEDVTTADPSEPIDMKIQEKAFEVADMIGDKTGIPAWVEVAIFVLIAVVIFCICGFCIQKFR